MKKQNTTQPPLNIGGSSESTIGPQVVTPSEGVISVLSDNEVRSNSSSVDGTSTGLKVKSQLSKDLQEQAQKTGNFYKDAQAGQKEKDKPSPFSPNNPSSTMSNFFSGKGPIKPQSMIPAQHMIIPSQQQLLGQMGGRFGPVQTFGRNTQDDYYEEEGEEYGDEEEGYDMYQQNQKVGGRILSPEQEKVILRELSISAQRNPEFIKVLNILANDPELRPLIFEHESLLKALKDMMELKAEQMLSILTAAETEMFETSQKQDQSQQLERTQQFNRTAELKIAELEANLTSETSKLRTQIAQLEKEKSEISQKFENTTTSKTKPCLKCQTYKIQTNELRVELQTNLKSFDALQEQLSKETKAKKDGIDDLRKQIDNLKTEREELKHKNKELTEKSANFQRLLKEMGEEVVQLQKKVSEGLLRETDAEQKINKLDSEKNQLHIQMIRVKSFAARSSIEENTETMKRPDSSRLRNRISHDDSSEQPNRDVNVVQDSFVYEQKAKGKRSQSSLTKMGQAIDFDDLESIGGDLNVRIATHQNSLIQNLREENAELKIQLRQVPKSKSKMFDGQKSQSPLATFSPLKEAVSESHIFVQPSLTETKDPVSHKLNEIGSRLVNLMVKLGCNVDRYRSSDFGVQAIKDMIYDIQIVCEDQMVGGQDSYSRFAPLGNQRRPYHQSKATMHFVSGDHSDTTMDITNFRANSGDRANEAALKNQLLEEKEKRLTIQESLFKTREEHFQYKEQIEQLKTELRKRPLLSTQDRRHVTQKDLNDFQNQIDMLQDENITHKLKIADLEQELIDERYKKKINYEVTVESMKCQVQEQVTDFKVKQEEKLLKEKEDNFKLRVQIQGLEERITVLKDQLNAFRYRILELEKENIQATKDNYILNTELDYESIKNNQIQKRTDKMQLELKTRNLVERSQLDQAVQEYENQIAKLQMQISSASEPNPFQRFAVEKLEHEVQQLKSENDNLQKLRIQNQVQIQKYMDRQTDLQDQLNLANQNQRFAADISNFQQSDQDRLKIQQLEQEVLKCQRLELEISNLKFQLKSETQEPQIIYKTAQSNFNEGDLKDQVQSLKQKISELQAQHRIEMTLAQNNLDREQQQQAILSQNFQSASQKLKLIQTQQKDLTQQADNYQDQFRKTRNLFFLSLAKRNSILSKFLAFNQLRQLVADGKSASENRELMAEQVYTLQNQNQMLCKQIGKIVRSVSQQKPIKLQLGALVSKQSLEYILAGLKNSQDSVQELNVNENELDDEDLFKICDRLQAGVLIQRLKLKQNNFQDTEPLIALIGQCGAIYTHLDFSQIQFGKNSLPKMCESLKQLTSIEELSICQILQDAGEIATNYLSSTLAKLRTLKCLDVSKNKFEPSQLNHLFNLLPQLQNLHTLAISQVNLSDQSAAHLCKMLEKTFNLKKLNISGNLALTPNGIHPILQKLKQTSSVQELDLSKLNFDETQACYRELADMILQNRKLRSLCLQQIAMSDQTATFLIEPLARSLNIENLKLDENLISGVWLEKYCKRIAMVGFNVLSHSASTDIKSNPSQSILATESGEDGSSRLSVKVSINSQINGMINLSLEGNEAIGDRGAEAISTIIATKSDATKNMKMINLNQCGIGNYGFQKLKQALVTRGGLTKDSNLTHVGIKVERNIFDQ